MSGAREQYRSPRWAWEREEDEELAPTPVPTPGRLYDIQQDKGGLLTTAGHAYGLRAGAERLQRAQEINNHPLNRKFWRPPASDFERRYFPGGIISFNPEFTCGLEQRKAKSGEQRCHARIWIPDEKPGPSKPERPRPPGSRHFILSDSLLDTPISWGKTLLSELTNGNRCQGTEKPVVGSDDRIHWYKTTIIPHRWICKIFTIFPALPSGGRPVKQATGFLLDKYRLVTNAHVLDTDIGVPDFLLFIPGFRKASSIQGTPSQMMPFGAFIVNRRMSSGVSNFYIAPEWRSTGDAWFDYGVVNIKEIRKLVKFPGSPTDTWSSLSPELATVAVQAISGQMRGMKKSVTSSDIMRFIRLEGARKLFTAGYPADRPCIQMLAQDRVRKTTLADNSKHNLVYSYLDATLGMSGSPVWVELESGKRKQHVLVGIHKGGITARASINKEGIRVATGFTVITPLVLKRLRNTELLLPAGSLTATVTPAKATG